MWLLRKFFTNRQLNKKLDHVKLKPFRIIAKVLNFIYKLDLPAKIKIYPIQYIAMLKPVHKNIKPPLYKIETYLKKKKTNKIFKKL